MIPTGPKYPRSLDRRSAIALGLGAGASLLTGLLPNLSAQDSAAPSELNRLRAEIERLKKNHEDVSEEFRHYRNVIAGNQARGPIPAVRAARVIVVDAKTGDILAEKNADARGPVASTQKLLTSLIIVESGNLEEYLTVQESDTDCAPVRIGLKEGETYPRIQLLTALLVKSSNDIAQALARDNAGSIEAFVDKMNTRAHALGMNDSHFVNPHGLPADDQYSTARDMARLALAADAHPVIRDLVEVQRFDFTKGNGSIIRLENTNRVMRSYGPCDGMKTGYTQLAGHCLVCSGEKDGKRRLVIVLNDNESVWKDAQALLEWALRA
ncbi:MAG: D-alanyl-D-alanine carboxypeptidase [Verrucomicrobia bacterium]|nr:D-alanyl-D-alanine carboxypeptidase [Verrucomicrobiota bacterium]